MKNRGIREFNPKTASEKEWKMYHNLFASLFIESHPEETSISLKDTKNMTSNFPDVWNTHKIVMTNGEKTEFIGVAFLNFRKDEKRSAFMYVGVAKKERRKGIAKILLAKILEFAQSKQRNLFTISTTSTSQDGEDFVKHMGMKHGQASSVSRVDFRDIDIQLMKKWRSELNEDTFEIGYWQDPYPEDEIEAYAKMENDFWASVPLDNLESESPWTVTADELRQRMKIFKEKNLERPVVWVKERRTGVYAGYSDVIVNLNKNRKIEQFATGVLGKYRRNGIGRAIKAEMILKILDLNPQSEFIVTANSTSNNSMLNINHEMGYRHFMTWNQWQITLEELQKYIDG